MAMLRGRGVGTGGSGPVHLRHPLGRSHTARTSATKRPRRTQGPSDAIALLKADHKTVEELFKQFERSSASAHKARRKLVDKMITELSMHAAIEEQFLYPQARREVPDATPDILEAMEEHHVVKWLLSELDHADPADERFDAKVRVLMESVRHHVREEEQELFPGCPRCRWVAPACVRSGPSWPRASGSLPRTRIRDRPPNPPPT